MDGLRFGRQYRALRIRMRLRQGDVATLAGVSRSLIAAIDRGQLDGVTLGSLRRATSALGAEIDLLLRWRGERLDRLVDEHHAALVEVVVRILREGGWQVATEVSFSIWGERGSIDVLAFHPLQRVLLVVEVKSVVPDSQETLHRLDQKTRLGPVIGRDREWDATNVSRLLAIGESSTSRRRIARLAGTYDVAFPDRGRGVRRWLREPRDRMSGLLFLSDDSHDGRNQRSTARERVRRPGCPPNRPNRRQTTATTAVGDEPGAAIPAGGD